MNLLKYKRGFVNIIVPLIIGGLAVITGAIISNILHSESAPSTKVGAVNYVTGGGTYRLASSISSTQNTIRLSSFKEPVSGIPYTMSYLNSSKEYGTLDPQTNNSEFISFTGITQNADGTATLTGVIRGLSRSYPYSASSTFQLTHSGQSIFILSNTPQIYNDIYDYINNATTSGAVDASPTVKGIVEISTAAEAASHAAASSSQTSAYLALTSSIASSTRTANTAQVVVTSATDGYIDSSYINTTLLAPAGSMVAYSSSTASIPTGWLLADGSAVSRTTYADLFTAIGTTYGSGDGATTFNLPAFNPVRDRIIKDSVTAITEGSASSKTYAHTVSGSRRYLLVFVERSGSDSITGVTYAGVAMTQLAKITTTGGAFIYAYGLANPTTGANNVVISASGAANIASGAISFNGVSSSTPVNATTTASGISTTITPTVDNSLNMIFGGNNVTAVVSTSTALVTPIGNGEAMATDMVSPVVFATPRTLTLVGADAVIGVSLSPSTTTARYIVKY